MNGKNKLSSMMFVGIIASIFTIVTVAVSTIILLERKKKKEDKELDEYLESGIN
ncbi:MAG: hypothetical protein ACI4PR_05550 [Acutalibacteraceae bacterium]